MTKIHKITAILGVFLVSTILLANCKKKKDDNTPSSDGSESKDTTTYVFTADNANIQYSGRISFDDPKAPKFSAPGVYIKAKFKGTSCTVLFKDQFLWGKNNYYNVIIDGSQTYKVKPIQGQTYYTVATNLEYKEHTVLFVKRTESSIGNCEFLGFRVSELLTQDPKPTRKIQLIGNSISCGAGSEASDGDPNNACSEDGWGQPYNNCHLAFGPVMARNLGAEYHVTAVSGIGMYRNYSAQYDGRTMPDVFGLLYLESNAPSINWDASKFQADAIVIELGTNDFSPGDQSFEPGRVPHIDSAVYVTAYVNFVNTLRTKYPNAHIFCLSSPMLNDGWPASTDKSQTDLEHAVAGVVEHFNNSGDAKVHKYIVPDMIGTGCGTHPSVAQHATIAAGLQTYVKSVMGW